MYLLPVKSDTLTLYQRFEAWALTQGHCTVIKVLRLDRGSKYLSEEFSKHLADAGTVRRLTVHDSLQLNGIAERLNQTLFEKVRALLYTAHLPRNMWGEVLRHATWLKNRTSTRALGGMTPWQALYGSPPNLTGIKHFGKVVWVHDADGSKLDACAREGHWLGFDVESHGHRIYWPATKTVNVEWNVYFAVAARLEGEHLDVPTSKTSENEPLPPPNPSTLLPALPPLPASGPPSPLSSLSSSSSHAVSEQLEALPEPEPLPEPVHTHSTHV